MEEPKIPTSDLKLKDTRISQGGLMRCCLHTVAEYIARNEEMKAEDRMVLDCAHEPAGNENMVLIDGVWRWNRIFGRPTAGEAEKIVSKLEE